jgi:hypothetical protein
VQKLSLFPGRLPKYLELNYFPTNPESFQFGSPRAISNLASCVTLFPFNPSAEWSDPLWEHIFGSFRPTDSHSQILPIEDNKFHGAQGFVVLSGSRGMGLCGSPTRTLNPPKELEKRQKILERAVVKPLKDFPPRSKK